MSTAVSIQDISKLYLLDHKKKERYVTFRDAIARRSKHLIRNLFGSRIEDEAALEQEEFWALKNVSIDIRHGETIGIIGRNGAGKSTLLKILSRITYPTKGRVCINSKISSLLEVGTGFHPELTGRENIFLNGAILGMTKRDIKRKFDEIVSFAEVEKFLDTPVKHYSSGMYVRLAFAVAANLEPEILIVDEVLAVGDAQFQKKCIGKMESVSNDGRTVIFVSHNMPTVTALCSRSVLLNNGEVIKDGPTSEVVMHYYTQGRNSPSHADFSNQWIGNAKARLLTGSITGAQGQQIIESSINEPIQVEMTFEVFGEAPQELVPNFHFYTSSGECAFIVHYTRINKLEQGIYNAKCLVPGNFLNEGAYFVGLALSTYTHGIDVQFYEKSCLTFNVKDSHFSNPTRPNHSHPIPGAVRPDLLWELHRSSKL